MKPKPGVHILNAHFILPFENGTEDVFRNFLDQISKQCKLIRFEDAVTYILSHNVPANETLVAFSYDDGFEECHTSIAPALESYGCNAGFFVNANYVESDEVYQTAFNKRVDTFTKKPMDWKQVIDLHERGHIIGSHTLDHFNLAKCSVEEAESQIVENKFILEDRLNYSCDYFAWPYGQHAHFSEDLLQVTKRYHHHIFSATDYKNYFSYNGQVINRRHVECYWPISHLKYFLSSPKKYPKDRGI